MVIMRFRNTTNEPITENIRIRGVFINNNTGEEFASSFSHFDNPMLTPLSPGMVRQASLESQRGFTHGLPRNVNISCRIYINERFFKEVEIYRRILSSDRI